MGERPWAQASAPPGLPGRRPLLTCGKLHVRLLQEAASRQRVAVQGVPTLSSQGPVDGGDGDHEDPHQRPCKGRAWRLGQGRVLRATTLLLKTPL